MLVSTDLTGDCASAIEAIMAITKRNNAFFIDDLITL
jgi:hypothetical protein